jgi:phage tail-like protein
MLFSRDKMKGTTGNPHGDAHLATAFTFEVEGLFTGGIHQVDGLTSQHDVVAAKDNDDRVMRFRPGNQGVINFTVTRDYAHTPEFRDWFKTIVDGLVKHRTCTISSMNDQHVVQSQIHVFGCWPKSYSIQGFDSKSSNHLVEVLEIVGHQINYA